MHAQYCGQAWLAGNSCCSDVLLQCLGLDTVRTLLPVSPRVR